MTNSKPTKTIDKHQRQVELVDKAYPYLMELAGICLENMSNITINVDGGHFEYVANKPEATKAVSNTRQTCINETRSTDKKANNPEDLWDWCCTEVYRLDNGEDVWKQINRVHQLALKEQREKVIEEVTNIIPPIENGEPVSGDEVAQGVKYGWNDCRQKFINNLQSLKEKK